MRSKVILCFLRSRKQFTLSTVEAEYISSTCACACEAVWIRRLLQDLQESQKSLTALLAMTEHMIFHACSRNMETCYYFIRKLVEKREIELYFCRTGEQLADILSKDCQVNDSVSLGVYTCSEIIKNESKGERC